MARKFEPHVLPRPDSHDLAWAAGFIDGEGCIRTNNAVRYETSAGTRYRKYLRMDVSQKHPALLERLERIFAVGHVYGEKNREAHKWHCSGRAAFYVIDLIWPWLGEQKKSDFKRTIRAVLETRKDWVRHPQRGQTYVAEGGQ